MKSAPVVHYFTRGRGRLFVWSALVVYLFLLIWLFLYKDLKALELEQPRFTGRALGRGAGNDNMVPGATLLYYLGLREKWVTGAWNVGGNLLGFIPLGVLLPLSSGFFQRLRPVALAGIALSAGIEGFQYFTGAGDCDVDDLLLNSAGTVIGFLLLRFVLKKLAA